MLSDQREYESNYDNSPSEWAALNDLQCFPVLHRESSSAVHIAQLVWFDRLQSAMAGTCGPVERSVMQFGSHRLRREAILLWLSQTLLSLLKLFEYFRGRCVILISGEWSSHCCCFSRLCRMMVALCGVIHFRWAARSSTWVASQILVLSLNFGSL